MSDYHLHLHPHEPTEEGPPPGEYPAGHIEAYVEQAEVMGVNELCFTEHLYRFRESEPVIGAFWDSEPRTDLRDLTEEAVKRDRNLSIESYVEAVTDAQRSGLPVRLGLELDFFPDSIESILEFIEPYPWDVLIGSIHWIGGWGFDTTEATYEFERRGIDQAWEDYFELETALAASGVVDVLAHVDVVKKTGFRPVIEPVESYQRVVEAAVASGTAVEVSSQGLRRPIAEIFPSPTFLAEFAAAGVPITLASDGHRPSEAGWGHNEVVEAARAAGYTSHLRFDRRRPVPTPL